MEVLVDIINQQRKIKISQKRLKETTKKILKISKELGIFKDKKKINLISISIVLIGAERMKELNYRYRGKKYVTDVLSFSYFEDKFSMEEVYLGEIVICPEKAKIQAKQYGVTLWQEIERLLIHGILHLFGYDHEKSAYYARKMANIEEKILKELQS